MPAKIRLARHGRKKFAFYHIVIADGRAPRDGRFIEKIGIYNPNSNPATIDLDFDRALDWMNKGAQPTETVRAILSYKGVLYKKHLLEGAKKGAFSEEEAEKRFAAWLNDKEARIQAKRDRLSKAADDDLKKRLEAESKIKETRAEELARKASELAEEEEKKEEKAKAKAEVKEEEKTEEKVEAKEEEKTEAKADVKEEEKTEEKVEAKAEVKEEEKTEEKADAKAEVKEEEKTEEKAEAKEEEKAEGKTGKETGDK